MLWALLMAPLLFWGLPSSRCDDLLFGHEPPWKADRYQAARDLEQLRTGEVGADRDLNPLPVRNEVVDLTADEASRAEILRRYRLYSRQPDEMIIFRALQRMRPRQLDFDPHLYQYGGGYLYLVGAALGAAALTGWVKLTGNIGVYLAHPEWFASFYVVARLVSLAFGALTLLAVHRLARRAAGRMAGWLALVGVACCPVFITAVLEAKPHLPSACMILWATLSALDYHARGRSTAVLRMGVQAGYALGLVLTGAAALLLWPALLLARPAAPRRRVLAQLGLAALVALLVYAILNPYVLYNGLSGRAALGSNIANSMAMYRDQMRQAFDGAVRVGQLLVESAGVSVPVIGIVGLFLLLQRRAAVTVIGAAAGAGMLVLCVLLGAGKPAEFARFLILPVLLLNVAAAWSVATVARRHPIAGWLLAVAVLALMKPAAYVRSFYIDARGANESRYRAARYLVEHMAAEDAIGVLQEPAPYAVPPLDFAHRRVLLLPPVPPANLDREPLPTWLVFTADDGQAHARAWWHSAYELVARFPGAYTPLSCIAWANKPVFIYRRNACAAPSALPPASPAVRVNLFMNWNPLGKYQSAAPYRVHLYLTRTPERNDCAS